MKVTGDTKEISNFLSFPNFAILHKEKVDKMEVQKSLNIIQKYAKHCKKISFLLGTYKNNQNNGPS